MNTEFKIFLGFNSTLVQLKAVHVEGNPMVRRFQFYLSSIKSNVYHIPITLVMFVSILP